MKGWAPLLLVCALLLGFGFWWGHRPTVPHVQGLDATVIWERDSLRAAYVADAAQWGAFRDSVTRLSPKVLVQVVTRYIRAHDTAWDTLETDPDTLLRTLLVQDSGCRLSLDSARSAVRISDAAVSRDSARILPAVRPWTVSALVVGDGTALRPGVEVARSWGRWSLGGGAFARKDGTEPGVLARAGVSF
jgi:hypothetical protein